MPKIAFKQHLALSKANKLKLEKVNEVIEDYRKQGFRMTLRQIYYQLVKDNIVPNKDSEYDKLGDLLVKGRMCGIVDWTAIVDRNRTPRLPYWYVDENQALTDTADSYRLDRQIGQDNYVEMWVEKDALSEILYDKSSLYHTPLMVNRGYTSCTAVYESFNRFIKKIKEGKKAHILYVGDHDPSGLDMIRDINDRLVEFGAGAVEVQQIALNMKQVTQYDLPPNPAKIRDPRAGWYIKNFGDTSWEVDALTPQVLHETIETSIQKLINIDTYNEMVAREKTEREKLQQMPTLITDLRQYRLTLEESISDLESDEESLNFADQIELNSKRATLTALVSSVKGFSTL